MVILNYNAKMRILDGQDVMFFRYYVVKFLSTSDFFIIITIYKLPLALIIQTYTVA